MIENNSHRGSVKVLPREHQRIGEARGGLLVRKLHRFQGGKWRDQAGLTGDAFVVRTTRENRQRRAAGPRTLNQRYGNFINYRKAILRGQAGPQF